MKEKVYLYLLLYFIFKYNNFILSLKYNCPRKTFFFFYWLYILAFFWPTRSSICFIFKWTKLRNSQMVNMTETCRRWELFYQLLWTGRYEQNVRQAELQTLIRTDMYKPLCGLHVYSEHKPHLLRPQQLLHCASANTLFSSSLLGLCCLLICKTDSVQSSWGCIQIMWSLSANK